MDSVRNLQPQPPKGWHVCRPVNERAHSDEEVRLKMRELLTAGLRTKESRTSSTNWDTFRLGRKFTESSVLQTDGATRRRKS